MLANKKSINDNRKKYSSHLLLLQNGIIRMANWLGVGQIFKPDGNKLKWPKVLLTHQLTLKLSSLFTCIIKWDFPMEKNFLNQVEEKKIEPINEKSNHQSMPSEIAFKLALCFCCFRSDLIMQLINLIQ